MPDKDTPFLQTSRTNIYLKINSNIQNDMKTEERTNKLMTSVGHEYTYVMDFSHA